MGCRSGLVGFVIVILVAVCCRFESVLDWWIFVLGFCRCGFVIEVCGFVFESLCVVC